MRVSKKFIKLSIAILLLALVIGLAACDFGGGANKSYSIVLDLNGGEGVDVNDFLSGNKLVIPSVIPTKAGCEFLGWFADKEFKKELPFNKKITADINIYAKWSDISWAVSFIYGGDIDSVVVFVNDKENVAEPTEHPQKDGYEFLGWYKNQTLNISFNFTEVIEKDTNIYAKWGIVSYQISYDFDGGTAGNNTIYQYNIESETVMLPPPTKNGFEFLGWYASADFSCCQTDKVLKGSHGDKQFYAKYLGLGNSVEKTNLGATIDGNSIIISVNSATEELTLDNSNITVSPRASFVVLDSEDQIVEDSTIVLYGQASIEDTPPYIVFDAKIVVTSEKGEEKTYTVAIRKYAVGATVTVTFVTGMDGITEGSRIIVISTKTTEPQLGEVVGYTFDGWYADIGLTNIFDFDQNISEDIILYGKWTPIVCSINYFVGLAQQNTNPTSYTIEDSFALIDLSNTLLYQFDGWYSDKNFTQQVTNINNEFGDKDLYAKFILMVDNSAMAQSYSGNQEFNIGQEAELAQYFAYAVYNNSATLSFRLNIAGSEYKDFLNNAWEMADIPQSTVTWGASYPQTDNAIISMTFSYQAYPDQRASEQDMYTQLSYALAQDYQPVRAQDFDDFKINSIANTEVVSTSEMLFYVLSQGYRPLVEQDSRAEEIYNLAKQVLRDIVDDSMDDITKLHKIYDWLILNVVYDKELFDMSLGEIDNTIHSYNGFYLEGVFFDKRAVCDGISKAFVVLARIEGIECYQVIYIPEEGNVGHAWNKVRIDGNYYIIDATSGGVLVGENEILTHKHFMVTEQQFLQETGYQGTNHTDKVAQTEYNIYQDIVVLFGDNEFDMVIESQEEFNALIIILSEYKYNNAETSFTVDVYIDSDFATDGGELALQQALNNANGGINSISKIYSNQYLILIFYSE